MSVKPLGNRKPLPASMTAAFDDWLEWCRRHIPDLEAREIEFYRRIFCAGGMAALHQANAGRYIATATYLNSVIYEAEGLTDHEKIEQADAVMDGTYPYPEGYPDGYDPRFT